MTAIRNLTEFDRWCAFVRQQPFPQELTTKPWKSTRSNEQNALLFGIMYPPIAESMGYPVDGDNGIHAFMCGTHFGWVDRTVPKTPCNPDGVASFPFRTTTRNEHGKRDVLTKSEFSRFIATVERIAASAGVFIPMEREA